MEVNVKVQEGEQPSISITLNTMEDVDKLKDLAYHFTNIIKIANGIVKEA